MGYSVTPAGVQILAAVLEYGLVLRVMTTAPPP